MSIDLLAFGPHPDDVEIGIGASVAKHVALGFSVAVCDLTQGEMGSNGTPEIRMAEAQEASGVLGIAWRENLGLPDRAIGANPEHVRIVAEFLRRVRPRTVAIPYWEDRHPDHVTASRLLTEAVFNARLRRYPAAGNPWPAERLCYYFINDSAAPSFLIDVSEHYETKRQALACYRSQFQATDPGSVATRLTSVRFGQLVESRDAQFGALAGVAFAEGLVVKEPVVLPHLLQSAAGVRPIAQGRS